MKRIHPEDPRITAHALGELPSGEAAELERAALLNPAVQEALDVLMLRQGLTYQVRYESFVLVYPGSFEKMKQHRDPRVAGLSAPGPPPGWNGGEFNPPRD